MRLNKVEEEFLGAGRLIGSVFLLRPEDGIRFIAEHRRLALPIYGMEGFHMLDDGRIQPLQEHTIDFEWENDNSHDKATQFLQKYLGQEFWFEIIGATPNDSEDTSANPK